MVSHYIPLPWDPLAGTVRHFEVSQICNAVMLVESFFGSVFLFPLFISKWSILLNENRSTELEVSCMNFAYDLRITNNLLQIKCFVMCTPHFILIIGSCNLKTVSRSSRLIKHSKLWNKRLPTIIVQVYVWSTNKRVSSTKTKFYQNLWLKIFQT